MELSSKQATESSVTGDFRQGEINRNPEAVQQALMFFMYTTKNQQSSMPIFKALATDATIQKESDDIANVIGELSFLLLCTHNVQFCLLAAFSRIYSTLFYSNSDFLMDPIRCSYTFHLKQQIKSLMFAYYLVLVVPSFRQMLCV